MKCPRCRLINPDSALRCDCGYDFKAGEMRSSYLSPGEQGRNVESKHILKVLFSTEGLSLVSFVLLTVLINKQLSRDGLNITQYTGGEMLVALIGGIIGACVPIGLVYFAARSIFIQKCESAKWDKNFVLKSILMISCCVLYLGFSQIVRLLK
jgi:hypothetical protein